MSVPHVACLPLVRPLEPSFMPKNKYRFDVPADSLNPRYQNLGVDISERFGDDDPSELLPVKQIPKPKLLFATDLSREEPFSVFLPLHRKYAMELLRIFAACATIDDLIATALIIRDQVNPYLFAYAYGVTLTHRKDTWNIELPPIYEIFPAKFFKRDVLRNVREVAHVVPENLRKPIEIPFDFTATNMDPENRMAYFREDIGINSHHWHWHLVFPIFGPDESFFNKDRRGELFYYMHQQILCRYNADRICNGLHVTEPLDDFRSPVRHGYYPKMTSTTSSRNIAPRQDSIAMHDLARDSESVTLTVNDLDSRRNRLLEAIDKGSLADGFGNIISLANNQAIDILGNLIEASALSVNPRVYGSLHNDGHTVLAFAHDPLGKHNEESGVMGDTTTAMRDPVFYRWHTMINNLFEQHKLTLNPYSDADLAFAGVKIDNVELSCGGKLVNELRTFWQKTDVNLRNGLDFAANESVYVNFTHLNYEHFLYKITVTNSSVTPRIGTVRIFMCSINNEAQQPYFIEGTRKHSIEMDKFTVNLNPGKNQIFRRSTESAITIPFEKTFPEFSVTVDGANVSNSGGAHEQQEQQFCGCGWPDHMLLMKGTPEGFPCRLFVMISDFAQDSVGEPTTGVCSQSVVFCGIRDQRYPDARPMGFPFDRPFNFQYSTLEDVINGRDNMFNRTLTVRHINKVLKIQNIHNVNIVDTKSDTVNGQ